MRGGCVQARHHVVVWARCPAHGSQHTQNMNHDLVRAPSSLYSDEENRRWRLVEEILEGPQWEAAMVPDDELRQLPCKLRVVADEGDVS